MSKENQAAIKRVYKEDREIDHDLFELSLTNTQKNMSWSENPEEANWVPVPHKHFFHNVDSDGKKQTKSVSSAGHYHEVWLEEVDGEMVAKCGPPKVTHKGKSANYKNDSHTHEVKYIYSEKIKVRSYSKEAQENMAKVYAEQQVAESNAAGMLEG